MLTHWAREHLVHVSPLLGAAFLAMGNVVDLLWLCSRPWVAQPETLDAAMSAWMLAVKAAFGEEAMPPKAHYQRHVSRWLRKYGFLINTFVHERKHKTIKKFVEKHPGGDGMDEHVLKEVTAHSLHQLGVSPALELAIGLQHPTAPGGAHIHAAIVRMRFSAKAFKIRLPTTNVSSLNALILIHRRKHSHHCCFRVCLCL